MNTNDKYFIIGGICICMVIAILSPFIASSNPDGLEKSSEQLGGTESGVYTAPFADYTISALGDSPLAGIAALALGVIVALLIAYVVGMIIKRRKPPEKST